MPKTKILCTLGPATGSRERIGELLDAGMSAARLNFSHGDHATHAERIANLRAASAERDKMTPIVADLQGPKVRTGKLEGGGPVELRAGGRLRLTPRTLLGDSEIVSLDYDSLAQDVESGDKILLADGALHLLVERLDGEDVVCEVLNDGELGERKGVNVPGADMKVPSITAKDKDDLRFALEQGVDYVAQSFVRRAKDVQLARNLIEWAGKSTHIIAKIEKPQALEDLEAILDAADGVMVARGDLGVELNPWQVPLAQKKIIEAAARWRKPVITATQMLESMIEHPSPTRAEASDVANAVFDGSDCLMLSAETAAGKYPIETVRMMSKIIEAAESSITAPNLELGKAPRAEEEFSIEVAHSAARLAEKLSAKYIVIYTETGYSAKLVSKHHPTCRIAAFSRHEDVCHRLKLLWGVRSKHIREVEDLDALVSLVDSMMRNLHWADVGDLIVVVCGTPLTVGGRTDLVKLHRIGQA
ncbi:MAG: pyruvate kinase [Bryobacterales bacterium]|nr:pyruvate kinase [Acidobacteriota bacterium]MCB9386156.1 pyruvate kinase [Bryobacterales bacterium]